MNQPPFVVYSPARTGSSLIAGNLEKHFGVPAVHTHDYAWTPPDDTYTAIISLREPLIDSVLSVIMAEYTDEYATYTDKTIAPFRVHPGKFATLYKIHRDFYGLIDRSRFQHVIEIWYDQLINDPNYLFAKLGIEAKTMYNIRQRSPYRYYDLFTNINQLQMIAERLDKFDDNLIELMDNDTDEATFQ